MASFKEWFATTRYWSFSVSALPVAVVIAYLYATCDNMALHWLDAMLAIVAVVLFHAAGNLLSDVGDYLSGADSREAYAVPNLVEHRFKVRQYLRLSGTLFAIGIALGLFLAARNGWPLLAVGTGGFLLTLLYTWSKNVFLSDLLVFSIFGVLILLGASVAATGSLIPDVMLLSLPIGLITLSVLHINNTVDIASDGKAGLHTIAMALGERHSVRLYMCYQLLPYLYLAVCAALSLLPWTVMLVLPTLPVAWSNVRQAARHADEGRAALLGLDQRSAKLQLLFSVALIVGFILFGVL